MPSITKRSRAVGALVAVLVAFLQMPAAFASNVSSAVFSGGSGTAVVGGVLYARNGAALTLTVTTSNDTECVDVTGAHAGHQTSSTPKTTWTFSGTSFTAGTGEGVQNV